MRTVLVFGLLVLAGTALAAPPSPAGFSADFVDKTLRIDFFHTGNAAEEVIALDRIFAQGIWAGSRTHLIDPSGLGRYEVKLFHAADGRLIFSRGFDSYFGEYRTTSGAEKGQRRTYHESVLVPYPKQKVRFTLEVRQRDKSLKPLFSTEIDPTDFYIIREAPGGNVKIFESWIGGDPHGVADIVILGEGYTAAEQAKFKADLERFTKLFQATEPYSSLMNRFSIRGVMPVSEESGCDEPSRGLFRRTALGASFDSLGSERYLLTEDNRALRAAAAHVPYDAIMIMVNQKRYGGGGIYNLYATFVSDNQWSEYIFIHEFGHSFACLADEYYTSSVAYNDFYPRGIEPSERNITGLGDPNSLKWKDLVTPGTPVPTPWEKTEFDALDRAFQKIREAMNREIAEKSRAGAPAEEVEALKAKAETASKEHADKIDAFLANSKFKGQVGAFEGAGYAAEGLFRSSLDCIMFTKGKKPFCAACRKGIRQMVEQFSE